MGLFSNKGLSKAEKEAIKSEKKYEKGRKKRERQNKRDERLSKWEQKANALEQKQLQHKKVYAEITGVKLEHLGGYPKLSSGQNVVIKKGTQSKVIKLAHHPVTVKGIEWDEDGKRSAGKAAVGAILGSVVGFAGTVAGAAVGGLRRDNSVLIMKIEDDGIEYTVYLRANQKEFQEVSSFLS
jgi:hypothetical protein